MIGGLVDNDAHRPIVAQRRSALSTGRNAAVGGSHMTIDPVVTLEAPSEELAGFSSHGLGSRMTTAVSIERRAA
jgi:hypothetical protein